MFDRLLRNTPAAARPKLLGILALTTWGGVSLALIAGWPVGLAWLVAGVVGFQALRTRAARSATAPAALGDDGEAEVKPALADVEDRIIARLRQMTVAEGASAPE